MNVDLNNALEELGRQLKTTGWQPEDSQFYLFSDDEGPDSDPLTLARLFLHSSRKKLQKLVCSPNGGVKQEFQTAPNYLGLAVDVLAEYTDIKIEAGALVDVFVHLSLVQLCESYTES